MSACQPFQVAFITGMSNPESWHLSPQQQAFIGCLGLQKAEINRLNFPYCAGSKPFKKTNIVRASVENIKMFVFCRGERYQQEYAPSVKALFDRAEHTLFLSGSCGLALLSNLKLPASYWEKISVFAYGPVSIHQPPCNTLIVQGEKDWISRLFVKQADHSVPGGHMSYLQAQQVSDLCQQYIAKIKRELGIESCVNV